MELVRNAAEEYTRRLRDACGPPGMFAELQESLLAEENLFPLCTRLLPVGHGDREQLVGVLADAEYVKSRRTTVPHLCRATTTRGLFTACSAFLTTRELMHGLARTSRAWFLFLRRNVYACAGVIETPIEDDFSLRRWDWLKEDGYSPVAERLVTDGSLLFVNRSLPRVTSLHIKVAELDVLIYAEQIKNFTNVKLVCLDGVLNKATWNTVVNPLLWAPAEFHAWWAALDVVEVCTRHDIKNDDGISELFPTFTHFQLGERPALQSPPLLRICAVMNGSFDIQDAYVWVVNQMRAGLISGLKRIEADVHYRTQPASIAIKPKIPPEVTLRVTWGLDRTVLVLD